MKVSHQAVSLSVAGVLMVAMISHANQSPHSRFLSVYRQVNLVSDLPGLAANTDPNLVNPWGIAITPNARIWVSDNGAGVSTIYQTDGTALSLVVTIPPPAGGSGTVSAYRRGVQWRRRL